MFGGVDDQNSDQALPTEMLVLGQDNAWTDLGVTTSLFPFAATINNEVLMQGLS